MLVKTVQQQIQHIYQLPQDLSIEDFLINPETLDTMKERQCVLPSIAPHKGYMLLFTEDDELHVGIYLHSNVIDNLRRYNPLLGLHEKNIDDFCLHFELVKILKHVDAPKSQKIPK